ncbi:MAG: DNA repair protein RecO [Actinobacteria bacterium]|nr:DNA repair protein RecO [Actinomycetota bacterium]
MSGLYRDQGVVLRSIKLGEADRIVSIMSQGHGKVRAVAKGIRKTGSKFGARLEPASHVAFQCYKGRELDIVTQVETIDANRALREHYGCLTHSVSMLEAVDQVALEREANPALYRMLERALRTLAERPSPAVSTAFFWKLLSLEGFHPVVDACARCGGEGPFKAWDLGEGGVLCASCVLGGRPITPESAEVISRIVGGGLNGVLADPPDDRVLSEVERLAISSLEYHSERRLKSATLL